MRKFILLFLSAVLLGSMVSFASCTVSKDNTIIVNQPTINRIQERGTILIGTTGDYRPLTFREADGTYWGFGIEVAGKIAKRLGVSIQFVPTSWPTLSTDVTSNPQAFDLAIGGITITDARKQTMLMSDGISSFLSCTMMVACVRFWLANFSFSPPGFTITRTSGLSISASDW